MGTNLSATQSESSLSQRKSCLAAMCWKAKLKSVLCENGHVCLCHILWQCSRKPQYNESNHIIRWRSWLLKTELLQQHFSTVPGNIRAVCLHVKQTRLWSDNILLTCMRCSSHHCHLAERELKSVQIHELHSFIATHFRSSMFVQDLKWHILVKSKERDNSSSRMRLIS